MWHDLDCLGDSRFMQKYVDRYCYFGSSSKSTTDQTSTNTVNPAQMAQYQQNYTDAQGRAATLTPYTGQLVAGFNPTQTQAQGILSNVGTDPTYGNVNNSAIASTQGVLANDPLTGSNLTQYENPYTSDVINASVAQNERARQTAQVNDSQAATAAGAFGGSRSGVSSALTNQLYDQNDQTNIANLNASNFNQAQNAALASSNLKLNAANQLTSLNSNALDTAAKQAGILSSVGDVQQQQQQQNLSAAYQAYVNGQQLTLEQQQLLNQALGLIPLEQTNNTTGTTSTQTNPGLGGILGSVGGLLGSVGSLAGGLGSLGSIGSGLSLGSSILGQATGSNAVGYGGLLGASANTIGSSPLSMQLPSLSMPMASF